jgi:hypothetical protein
LSLITKLDTSKANGHYGIPIYLIKWAKENISKPITTIFNNSFATGIFPQYLELSKIIPHYRVYIKKLNPFKFKLVITYCSNLTALIALN